MGTKPQPGIIRGHGGRSQPRRTRLASCGLSCISLASVAVDRQDTPGVEAIAGSTLPLSANCLPPLDPLGMLWIPLNDGIQMEAFEPVEVVIVSGLRRRVDHLEILFYAHRFTSSFRKGLGYSKRAPPRLPSRGRITFSRIMITSLLRMERPN